MSRKQQLEKLMPTPPSSPASQWPAHTRILIVEDNDTNLVVTRLMLAGFGLEADVAKDGAAALRIMAESSLNQPYTLVLMDCQMPEMDGFEATRQIRAGAAGDSHRAVVILAMTANIQPSDREKCFQAGMNDFIPKPVDADALEQRLRHWLLSAPPVNVPELRPEGEALLQTDPASVSLWDDSALLAMLKGRHDRLQVLLETFLDAMPARLKRLEQAVASRDVRQVEAVAHSVKGSAGQLKAMPLQIWAARLEASARAGDWGEMLRLHVSVNEASDNLERRIRDYLSDC